MINRLQQRLDEIGAPDDVRALAAELTQQAVRDPLTGLYNRRVFDETLAQQIETARRYSRPLSLVLFDLDRLKAVNDRRGHEAGDDVLKTFARILRETARKADLICRIGGDEFAAVLPETTAEKAEIFAERLCRNLDHCKCAERVGASFGIAELPSDHLFSDADSELLLAKRNRNRG